MVESYPWYLHVYWLPVIGILLNIYGYVLWTVQGEEVGEENMCMG